MEDGWRNKEEKRGMARRSKDWEGWTTARASWAASLGIGDGPSLEIRLTGMRDGEVRVKGVVM